jgi:hypothetical protein
MPLDSDYCMIVVDYLTDCGGLEQHDANLHEPRWRLYRVHGIGDPEGCGEDLEPPFAHSTECVGAVNNCSKRS